MKYMIISDVHGGIYELNKVLEIYRKEKYDTLIFLGDLFNYGIDPNKIDVVNRLNLIKNNIIAVRGNCDSSINDILFDMPYINKIKINNRKALLTHGHLFNKSHLINMEEELILIGHSHIYNIELIENKIFINPGSISKSRNGENSFAVIDENNIYIKNLNNEILKKFKLI